MPGIEQAVLRREDEVHEIIEKYSALFDLDPNLIRAVITQESYFVAEACSSTNAYGYGQFTNIGARQVQNISRMTSKASDLSGFTKAQADEDIAGIKAICATFWWLLYKKYRTVSDKKVQLEAALTFYNAGGRPAALIVKHGGHAEALDAIKALPRRYQGQSADYAPRCAARYVAWHDHFAKQLLPESNPFDTVEKPLEARYRALVEALLLLAKEDTAVDIIVNSRDGLTEFTLLFPGEIEE